MQREKTDKQVSLSIVVPIYNQEPYLTRCVDSLLALELEPQDYELVLVNDGSADGSGDICMAYAAREGQRVRYAATENRGVSAARNLGVREAAGEYVAFVDGDDWVEPWMFTQMLALMKERPEMELSTCGICYEYQGKVRYRDPSLPSDRLLVPGTAFTFMMEGRYLRHYPVGKIYKKALLEKCPFPEDMKLGEDLIFHIRLFEHLSGPVGYFRSEGYHYDMRFDSASQGRQISQEFLDRAYLETQRLYEALEESDNSWRQFEIGKFCYRAVYKRLLRLFLIDDPQEKHAGRIQEYQRWGRSLLEKFSLLENYETARAQKQELHFLLLPYEEARSHYHAFVTQLWTALKNVSDNFSKVYFFGMGLQGLCLAILSQTRQVKCEGIVANDISMGFWEGLYLRTADSIAADEDTAFILAGSDKANKQMAERLLELGHRHVFDTHGKPVPGSESLVKDLGGRELLAHDGAGSFPQLMQMTGMGKNCRRVFWGAKESECAYPVRQIASMVKDGDIFVDEDAAIQGRMLLGCPVCSPEVLKGLTDRFVIVVLIRDYSRIRDWLVKRGFVENVDFVQGGCAFADWEERNKQNPKSLSVKCTYETCINANPKDYPKLLEIFYRDRTGKELNLANPRTFNEKIQWMKLYDSTPIKTRLADKFLVREWISNKIGKQYLVPLLGVWDKFGEIDFQKLPDKFVLKCNHGSGWNLIVTDKSKLDIKSEKEKFDNWLRTNYAFCGGLELHYKNIKPKIIAEEYLENADGIIDYRFYCFSGKPVQVWVDIHSGTPNHLRTIYDVNWRKLPMKCGWPDGGELLEHKPDTFEQMKEIATLLSKDFAFVRVDFFEIDKKLYMGEMTFTPMSGIGKFEPDRWDAELGKLLILPEPTYF